MKGKTRGKGKKGKVIEEGAQAATSATASSATPEAPDAPADAATATAAAATDAPLTRKVYYRVSASHRTGDALKTDAPPELLWDIMRTWVKTNPIASKRSDNPNSPGNRILAQEPVFPVDFKHPPSLQKMKRDKNARRANRHPHNPEEHWG
jgi:hypothetical protein